MRFCNVMLLAGCLLVGCASQRLSPSEQPLVGTWSGQGQANSYSWNLASDGKFGKALGFVLPKADSGSWRIEGDQLILSTRNVKGQTDEQRYRVDVAGRTMTVHHPDGTVDVLTRVD